VCLAGRRILIATMRLLIALLALALLSGCVVVHKGWPTPAPFLYNPEPSPTKSFP
jgi:hypothetical protein